MHIYHIYYIRTYNAYVCGCVRANNNNGIHAK